MFSNCYEIIQLCMPVCLSLELEKVNPFWVKCVCTFSLFKTASSTDLACCKSGSLVSKYVVC